MSTTNPEQETMNKLVTHLSYIASERIMFHVESKDMTVNIEMAMAKMESTY